MFADNKFDFLYKYDSEINWNVTGFGNEILMYIVDEYINHLQEFNVTIPIKTIHGSYISKYNGGRLALYTRPISYVCDKIKHFNNLGIGVKLTFSTPNINKEMFDDTELNTYLEVLNDTPNLNNGIICSVDNFAEFIHNKYPNIEVTSSYVKMATETQMGKTDTFEYYNRLFNIYDKVVVNTFRAFDDDFIENIIYKDRIEFIVNNGCNVNCPIAIKHYDAMYRYSQRIKYLYENKLLNKIDPQLELIQKDLLKIGNNCLSRRNNKNIDNIKYQQINRNEINILLKKGIKNFKIEGRDINFDYFRTILFTYIFNNDSILRLYSLNPGENIVNDWNRHKLIFNDI